MCFVHGQLKLLFPLPLITRFQCYCSLIYVILWYIMVSLKFIVAILVMLLWTNCHDHHSPLDCYICHCPVSVQQSLTSCQMDICGVSFWTLSHHCHTLQSDVPNPMTHLHHTPSPSDFPENPPLSLSIVIYLFQYNTAYICAHKSKKIDPWIQILSTSGYIPPFF